MKTGDDKMKSQPLRPMQADLLWWLGVSVVGLAAAWFLARMPGQSVDWTLHFYPAGRLYVAGETLLYDAQTTGFYHPPWVIWLLLPFTLLPIGVGLFMLRVASVMMIAAAVPYLFIRRPRWVLVIQLLTFLPLLRVVFSPSYAWLDLLYVLVIFGAVLSLVLNAEDRIFHRPAL